MTASCTCCRIQWSAKCLVFSCKILSYVEITHRISGLQCDPQEHTMNEKFLGKKEGRKKEGKNSVHFWLRQVCICETWGLHSNEDSAVFWDVTPCSDVVGYQCWITLKMEAAWSSEMLVSYQITTWCQNPENHDLTSVCFWMMASWEFSIYNPFAWSMD